MVVSCAMLATRAMGLYEDLQQAERSLTQAASLAQRVGFDITPAEARTVTDGLAHADAALSRAASVLDDDPLLGIAMIIPPAGQQLDAASDLVRATREVTKRSESIDTMLDGFIAARDGEAGAGRIAAFVQLAARLRPDIGDLAMGLSEADATVSAIPVDGLVEPLARAHGVLADRLDQVSPLVGAADTAASVLPGIMGADGRRRYLVLALDNAEIRPIGGLIAAFATPTFEDGSLSDQAFRDILAIDRQDQQTYVEPPEALADHLLGDFTWQVADAGWWPDFGTSVQEVRRMYRIETGEDDFQGVIAFTPELVDRLLEVVGPVTIESAGITVTPGDTYLVSLEQVEVLNQGEGRKAFLADLASQVMARLFALPPARYPDVLAALDEAGQRRQLQVLFDDQAAQVAIAALGWPGPFTFPSTGDRLAIMESNVAPVSKLNVLLSLDHALDVQLAADGSATEQLVTTYTNQYGPDLPPELERVRSTFLDGFLGSYSRRYLVPGAEVISVTSDDPESPVTDPDAEELEADSLVLGNYQFVQPGTVRLTTEWYAPDVVESATDGSGVYRLTYRKQAGRDRDALTVSVTVPEGSMPTSWSEGGVLDGRTVTFAVTSEFDHTFEVGFGPL